MKNSAPTASDRDQQVLDIAPDMCNRSVKLHRCVPHGTGGVVAFEGCSMTTYVTDYDLEHLGVDPDEIERLRDADDEQRRKVVDRELRHLMSAPGGR